MTPTLRQMSANEFRQYCDMLLSGGSEMHPLPAFDPADVVAEFQRRLSDVPQSLAGEWSQPNEGPADDRWAAGARAAANLAQQIANKWKTYEIKSKAECAQDIADAIRHFIDTRNEPIADDSPAPIDWSRPIVWVEDGRPGNFSSEIYGNHDCKFLVGDGSGLLQAVNATGCDRSGKQVVKQKDAES